MKNLKITITTLLCITVGQMFSHVNNETIKQKKSNSVIAPCTGMINTYPYQQSFENTLGNWSQGQSDDIDWTLLSGSTPSTGTGPTAANEGTYYIYIEATDPNHPSKTANLISPCFDLSGKSSAQFSFAYHMYGSAMGTLNLEASLDDGASWNVLWTLSGDQGNSWNSNSVDISQYVGSTVRFRFSGVTGSSYQSDFTIDNISVSAITNTSSGTSVWSETNSVASYTGDVAIGTGTVPSGYKMAIDGKLITEEVKVQLSGDWPDYVFTSDYDLLSLEEIQKHIKEKGHLPNIPSAKDTETNGIEVGEMSRLLLEKIEELTLYIIELKNENKTQQIAIENLKKQNK